MDLFDVLIRLVMGALFAIPALQVYVKHRSIGGMLFWLSFGVAFIALGLLEFYGLLDGKWANVCFYAVVGVLLTITSTAALRSPPTDRFPRWTQWASLVMGVSSLLGVMIVVGLSYRWH
jgi:hypothetical protein